MDELDIPEPMKSFNEYVDNYIEQSSTTVLPLDVTLEEMFNYTTEELQGLSSQQCMALAFKISGYAMYIRGQINSIKPKLDWCETQLNLICGKAWSNYDPYLKFDLKKQAIIADDSFASKVEKLRLLLQAKLTVLDDKLVDIRNMSDILQEMGKRKSYNERG